MLRTGEPQYAAEQRNPLRPRRVLPAADQPQTLSIVAPLRRCAIAHKAAPFAPHAPLCGWQGGVRAETVRVRRCMCAYRTCVGRSGVLLCLLAGSCTRDIVVCALAAPCACGLREEDGGAAAGHAEIVLAGAENERHEMARH